MSIFSSIGNAFAEGWNTEKQRQKLAEEHINKNPYTTYYKENIGKISFMNDIESNFKGTGTNSEIQQTADYKYYSEKTTKKEFIYENPFKLSQQILDNATKNYQFIYKNPAYITGEYAVVNDDKGEHTDGEYFMVPVIPSMFNPLYGINIIGMNGNTPVINTPEEIIYKRSGQNNITQNNYPDDLSDCSIKKLVELSDSGKLGRGIFKYADFMYCKNLGKYANNRLLTLRRFPVPIGDNIWDINDPSGDGPDISGDIGRLVTWMDDTNKLEDILKYNYTDSFTEKKEGKFIDIESRDDQTEFRGILGSAINLANPKYRNGIGEGKYGGGNKILGMIFDDSKIFSRTGANSYGSGDNQTALWERYDNNRVYEPKGTVRDTHLYEGKLTFEQNFSITFDYELRAYENINPRTAFLDLLNNIQQVTYRKGTFWGGEVWWKGAPENKKGWQTANALIDGTFEKLSNTFSLLASGSLNVSDFFSGLWESAQNIANNALTSLGNAIANPQETLKKGVDAAKKLGIGNMLRGMVKNKLGRPALYASDSILSGEPVGLWHLTVGNPRNPIMSIGNLIIDGSTIQQYGPLGLDDFPTGLKVTVNLKHGRSRDMMEIGKMYTMGRVGLSVPLGRTEYQSMLSNTNKRNTTIDDKETTVYDIYNNKVNPNTLLYTANQFATMWASTLPTANQGSTKDIKTKQKEKDKK